MDGSPFISTGGKKLSEAKHFFSLFRPVVDRFPRIASTYRAVRDHVGTFGEPTPTPFGFKLAGNADMAAGRFEPDETALVRNLLGDVDVLVNIGANIGYYCCHALCMGKSIIAFEPMQRNLHYLCKNINGNSWADAEIYPVALSNRIGVLEIYGGNTGASVVKGWAHTPANYVTLVPCSTLDTVVGRRLAGKKVLVLVDIEGAEFGMLQGAGIMLASDPRPAWVVEITATEHQPDGIPLNPNFQKTFELFFEHGYQAYSVGTGSREITMDDVNLISSGALRLGTHNFLFR